jgi:hypothetical protein
MKLYDLLKLIDGEFFPTILTMKNNRPYEIDTRPQSVFHIMLCFMCEENTWVRVHTMNEILIPWYDCKVKCIQPHDDTTIEVWLDDKNFIYENYREYLEVEEL